MLSGVPLRVFRIVIFDALRDEGYPVSHDKRILKGVKRTPIDVFQVDVEKTRDPSIYEPKRPFYLSVTVERRHKIVAVWKSTVPSIQYFSMWLMI